jgi:tetratricopeptide (TPR) repeat protein
MVEFFVVAIAVITFLSISKSSENIRKNVSRVLNFRDRVSRDDSDDHEAWYTRGIELGKLGRYEEAISAFDKSLQINSSSYATWCDRGSALSYLSRYEESLRSYDQAIQINPDNPKAWFGKTTPLFRLERYEEMNMSFETELTIYDRALIINSNNHEILRSRCRVLGNLGRNEERISAINRLLQLDPNDYELLNQRGIALSRLGRYEEAIASCDQALQVNPNYQTAKNNRDYYLRESVEVLTYDQSLRDKYQECCNEALELGSLDKYDEALIVLDRAIATTPKYSHKAWYLRGLLLERFNDWEAAVASYDRALQIKPDYDEALKKRETALERIGLR